MYKDADAINMAIIPEREKEGETTMHDLEIRIIRFLDKQEETYGRDMAQLFLSIYLWAILSIISIWIFLIVQFASL